MKKKTTAPDEVAVIRKAKKMLDELTPSEQKRVVTWLCSKYNEPATVEAE